MRNFSADKCISSFFKTIYIAGIVALPVGIGLYVSVRNGKLGGVELYRSGYICGKEPPTREDIAARGNISTCLDIRMSPGSSFSSLCLQAGGLDKPAVWCNEEDEYYPYYLCWSPCDKCGTAWRIFDSIDNDQSWYKRLTSAQSNSTALPPEDEWLYWSDYSSEWLDIDMNITSCSTLEAAANSSWDTIPSSCFSDAIYVGVNPWSNAASSLLIIGGIFWFLTLFCGCLKCINPRHCPLNRFPDKDDDSRDDYGHITICCGYLLCTYRVGEQEVAAD